MSLLGSVADAVDKISGSIVTMANSRKRNSPPEAVTPGRGSPKRIDFLESDVRVVVGKDEVYAYGSTIARNSPKLSRLMFEKQEHKDGVTEIKFGNDFDATIWKIALSLINALGKDETADKLSQSNCHWVWTFGQFYDIDKVKRACHVFVMSINENQPPLQLTEIFDNGVIESLFDCLLNERDVCASVVKKIVKIAVDALQTHSSTLNAREKNNIKASVNKFVKDDRVAAEMKLQLCLTHNPSTAMVHVFECLLSSKNVDFSIHDLKDAAKSGYGDALEIYNRNHLGDDWQFNAAAIIASQLKRSSFLGNE